MRGELRWPAAAVALAVLGGTPAEAGPKDVPIKYVGGETCVEVAESVEIYADHGHNWGKSKKVEWIVDKEQRKRYHWQVVYKGDGDDLIGPVEPIACSEKKTESKKTRDVSEGERAEWVYKVVVSECGDDGSVAEVMCETDPIIVIKGGP